MRRGDIATAAAIDAVAAAGFGVLEVGPLDAAQSETLRLVLGARLSRCGAAAAGPWHGWGCSPGPRLRGATGWRLSEGERARFSLLRALRRRPDVLHVYGAFEALDPDTAMRELDHLDRQPAVVRLVIGSCSLPACMP